MGMACVSCSLAFVGEGEGGGGVFSQMDDYSLFVGGMKLVSRLTLLRNGLCSKYHHVWV